MSKNDDKVTTLDSRRKTNNTAKTAKAVEAIRAGKGKKKPREVSLGLRTAKVKNLNFSPEKAGDKLVERADLSLEFLIEEADVPAVVFTRGNPLQVLWDGKGEPQLREVPILALDLRVVGEATFNMENRDDDDAMTFEDAVMKKATFEPMLGRKGVLRCQVRVDPTDSLEELAALVIEGKCKFSFVGAGAAEDEDDQGKLNV
jgi:hypothetical protein